MRFQEEDENVYLPIAPPPQLLPFTGPKWGHPGTWHEQILFFTHKGIYTQHNFAQAVLDLEKKKERKK